MLSFRQFKEGILTAIAGKYKLTPVSTRRSLIYSHTGDRLLFIGATGKIPAVEMSGSQKTPENMIQFA